MKNFLKKYRVIIIILIFLVTLVILRGSEDTWICDDGQWVKHGVPSAPMPEGNCS